MLQWLPGADPATRDEGERTVKRALELYGTCLSESQRKHATIALAESGGLEVAVVFHRNQRTADRIAARLRKAGVAATGSASCHAEIALFEKEPGITVIGISNARGPCPACKQYFGNLPNGFANVYWDDSRWIFP
jgi:hypothetical protein